MFLEIGMTLKKTALPERLELASEIIKSFGTAGLENTMTTFNGK
jgi:PTH1 family peptidyl-tRNA hydrolase